MSKICEFDVNIYILFILQIWPAINEKKMGAFELPSVSEKVFRAMQTLDIAALSGCSDSELRPVLPGLVRMALCSPLDDSDAGKQLQKSVFAILSRLEVVNSIVSMLSIDFHALEQDVTKEQKLR